MEVSYNFTPWPSYPRERSQWIRGSSRNHLNVLKKRTAVDLTGSRTLERLVSSVIAIPNTLLQLLLFTAGNRTMISWTSRLWVVTARSELSTSRTTCTDSHLYVITPDTFRSDTLRVPLRPSKFVGHLRRTTDSTSVNTVFFTCSAS